MPDPIKDLQAGLSDDKLKQKYKMSDDDVFNLRKFSYVTTKGGASVDDALELYPTVSKYVKPAGSKTPIASEIETFDPKNLKVGNDQPVMPNGKAQPDITPALKKQMQDNAPAFSLGQAIASQPAKELIAQETGVPVNMQRTLDPVAAPEPKEDKQAIKNQEDADILYSTPQGRMYYDLIQPIWKTATKAGGNIAAAVVRGSSMVVNPLNKALGNDEKSAAIADGLVDYFDFDRRAKENRTDAAIYATPTKLQGNLINDGKVSTTKLIPKTIENLTNMAILVGGGGVGKGALFVKSYLMTEEDYRKQGKDAGLKGGQLDAFATVAAGLTSVLEGISPNNAALGQFKPKLVAAAVKDIKAGVSVTTALKRAAKEYGSENAKEVGQELFQNFGDHVVKKVSDESFDSQFNDNMQYKDVQKEVLETALMTILPTTLLMTPSAIRQYRPNNQTISSLDFAADNQEVFNQAVDKSVASGQFTDTDAQTMKDNVGLYSTKVKQMREMGYSPDQSARIAFAAYKDAKTKVGTQAITDSPVLKATLGAEAKKDEEQLQNEVKDAAMGIPEVGTELSGVDLSKIVNNTPNSPSTLVDQIKDKDYVVDEIDLQEKYDNDPAFKLQVEAAKESKEDPEGLRTPAIIDQSGEVLDGNKRLAQQFADGETTARVFRELKAEPDTKPSVIMPQDNKPIETITIQAEEPAIGTTDTSSETPSEVVDTEPIEPIDPDAVDYEAPVTNYEKAKSIADKMRAFASSIEVDANAAYSRPDVIPRAMLATGIRLAAKAVEAGGAIADGIKAAVDYIKSQNTGMDDNMIREEVVNAIVGAGIKQAPKRTSVKASIKGATNTTVKNKIVTVVNELDALRKQIKEKYKTIVANELRANIDDLLNKAEERGAFTSTAKATAVASIARILNKATTPAKLLKAVDKIGKVIENVEYEKDLNQANDTRSKIAKAIKGKSLTRAASNVETTKAFLKIKPENVSDLAAYNEIAAKVLETQKAASVKIVEGKGVAKDEAATLANRDIRKYTDDQLTFAEEQAKQKTAENYQDLVDIGVIDPNTMSLEEMQAIIDGINDPAATPEQIQDLNNSKQKEKENAFRQLIEMQQSSLQEMMDDVAYLDLLTPQEDVLVRKILALDPKTLSISQMVRMNDVINNIIANGEFFGAGELAILSDMQADNKTMATEIKASGINLSKFADNLFGRMAKGFASVQLMFEFIAKSTKLASRMQQLSGIRAVFNGHSRATVTQEATLAEYDKLKRSMGKRLDEPENRYRRGVYARIVQDLGGTAEDIKAEFDRVKQIIQFSYERLSASEDKTDIQEGKVLQKVYDEILKDSESAADVRSKLETIEPANIKLVEFWQNKFGERVDEVAASSEIYNNKIFERYNNYTATKAKKINGEPITSEQEDIFKVTMSSKKLDVSPSKTKLNRIKTGMLPAGTVFDLDFDSVQAERFFQTNYDLETAPAIAKVRAFFDSPDSAKLLGGQKNKNTVMENIRQAVLKQKNKQLPAPEAEQNFVKLLNVLQVKGARIALGSLSQLPKQYLSVASSTLANLGTDLPLYFKAFGVSNKIKLFDLSSIATRGGAKAGYNHDADVAAIERSITANDIRRNTKEVMNTMAKIAESSMSALVKSDVSVARTSWLAYYMQDLKRQGTDISTIDWNKAHESFNEEAAAYAEQMVSRSQNPNNNTELATYYRDTKGLGSVLKNLVLPFSSFSTNQRVRMTNDMQKIWKGGNKAEAARSLAATVVETGVFNAIKIYALSGWITTPASQFLASVFGMWDEEDEKKVDDYQSVDIKVGESTFNVSDKQKRLVANMMNDYLFSGLGGAVQGASQKGMNWIYSNIASEEYPNGGKASKSPKLFYEFDDSKNGGFSSWGMYGILPTQVNALSKNAEEAILGQTDRVVKGGMGDKVVTEKTEITTQEQQAAALNFMINSFALFGIGDAEVTNINRKLGAIMEKKMKARYGGENTITISSKGKGQPQSSEGNLP